MTFQRTYFNRERTRACGQSGATITNEGAHTVLKRAIYGKKDVSIDKLKPAFFFDKTIASRLSLHKKLENQKTDTCNTQQR